MARTKRGVVTRAKHKNDCACTTILFQRENQLSLIGFQSEVFQEFYSKVKTAKVSSTEGINTSYVLKAPV